MAEHAAMGWALTVATSVNHLVTLPPRRLVIFALFGLAAGCQTSVPVPASKEAPSPPWFRDVTAGSGVDFVHDAGPTGSFFLPQIIGSGAAVLDFNDDGLLDLYFLSNGGPQSRSTNRLFQQLPGGRFKDVSAGSGLDIAGHNMGVAVGDVDNDGRPDVLITQYGGIRLFHNDGGVFSDITEQAGLHSPLWGTTAAFFDFDRDGWLDLVVANYVDYDPSRPCRNGRGQRDYCGPSVFDGSVTKLFHNRGKDRQGNARFDDLTAASGLSQKPGPGLGVICADFSALERDDLSASLEHLRPAQDDSHARRTAHLLLAEIHQRRGERAAAEKALHEGQDLPDDAPWPDSLYEPVQDMVVGYLEVITHATALIHQNQAEQAIPLLQRAAEDYPEAGWACVLLGRAWLSTGDLAAAEKALRESLRRSPDMVDGHFYLGVVLSEQKDFAGAIPYFRKAVQLKPDYALAWYNLGICLNQQGDRAGAGKALRKSIACKPQFAPARINLGELLAEDGHWDAAEEQLRLGVQMVPDDKRARQLLEEVRKRKP